MKTDDIPHLLPFEGIKTKKVDETDHFKITLVSLAKGERLEPHTSPLDAFIYVLEGNANFNMEGKAYYLQAGDGLSFKAHITHSVNALTGFKMLLIR
jgi:quercetin dioxygenase-like cupin family protein